VASCFAACATFAPPAAMIASSKVAEIRQAPVAEALRRAVEGGGATPDVQAFYRERGYRPLWTHAGGVAAEAHAVARLLMAAAEEGLEPGRYRGAQLAGRLAGARGAADLAALELDLSHAYARYAVDVQTPPAPARLDYYDAALPEPAISGRAALQMAAAAPSLAEHLAGLRPANPIYLEVKAVLAEWRSRGGSARQEALIRANLERARALPKQLGRRFIWVDIPAGTLWAYEDGQVRDSMAVVVGKQTAETPQMAGLIRFAVFNPYWNVPPDLARYTYAPKVLAEGPGALDRLGMEALSDWSADARVVPLETVDWTAVREGRERLRLRQLPGPGNTMGRVKLMLPNRLGIYLHDTPDKWAFAAGERMLSSGCIRLQDAERLARWLLGEAAAPPAGLPEERRDLPEPVPVYVTYLTVGRTSAGVVFRQDLYGRDPSLVAALSSRSAEALAVSST
jgi:L,D-transpeptidase YcbB